MHAQMHCLPETKSKVRPKKKNTPGRALEYLFSREHDIFEKWQKFSEQTGRVLRIQLITHSTLGVYDNRPPLARYVQ